MAETYVNYDSLEQAINDFNKYANELLDPIRDYETQTQGIGENGTDWGGDAAAAIEGVLRGIKNGIKLLQNSTDTYRKTTTHITNQYIDSEKEIITLYEQH